MRTRSLHLAISVLAISVGCGAPSAEPSASQADASVDAMAGDGSLPLGDDAEGGGSVDASAEPPDAGREPFDARPAKAICDGSKALRFAARIRGRYGMDPDMMTQIGMSYIYVSGECSFWSNKNVGAYALTHEGKLSATDAEQLSRDFGYGYWDSLQDFYTGADSSHTSLELYDARKRVVCSETACERYGSDMGRPIVSGFWPAYRDWSMKLEALGHVVTGDLRALVLAFDDEESIADAQMRMFLIKWPNAWPLADLVGDFAGLGVVTSGARADDLRALRAMYAGQGAVMPPRSSVRLDFFSLQVANNMRTFHQLWLRDAIPLEDARGTIPLGDAGL